jgi:hypothetical protein
MTIPSWVAGTTVVYAFAQEDDGEGVEGTNTLTPLKILGNAVEMSDVAKSEETKPIEVAFTVGTWEAYGYQFWVDPSNPTGTYRGPQNETYTVRETEIYDGVAATFMSYSDSEGSGHVIFENNNGLILEETATVQGGTTIQALALVLSKNADGSYDLFHAGVTGAYSSYEDVYSKSGAKVAESRDNTNGTGSLILYGDGLTVSSSFTQQSVQTGADVFAFSRHSIESVVATGMNDEAFVYKPSFGEDLISGFLATGGAHDTVDFSASMFSYLKSGMTVAQELAAVLSHATQTAGSTLISDTMGDVLALDGITKATLTANPADIKFT